MGGPVRRVNDRVTFLADEDLFCRVSQPVSGSEPVPIVIRCLDPCENRLVLEAPRFKKSMKGFMAM